MADWIYCATSGQVAAANTASLASSHEAIWCPPQYMPSPPPQPEDRLWLVWRDQAGNDVGTVLLAAGRVRRATAHRWNTDVLWTNTDLPDVQQESVDLGYTGPPQGRGFLRLRLAAPVLQQGFSSITGLGTLNPGLNEATTAQVQILEQFQAIV